MDFVNKSANHLFITCLPLNQLFLSVKKELLTSLIETGLECLQFRSLFTIQDDCLYLKENEPANIEVCVDTQCMIDTLELLEDLF